LETKTKNRSTERRKLTVEPKYKILANSIVMIPSGGHFKYVKINEVHPL